MRKERKIDKIKLSELKDVGEILDNPSPDSDGPPRILAIGKLDQHNNYNNLSTTIATVRYIGNFRTQLIQ